MTKTTISFLAFVAAVVFASLAEHAQADILCVCRCCYLGECAPLENASWPMSDCTPCTVERCREHVQSPEVRRKIARLFEVFQEDDLPLSAAGAPDGTSEEERALIAAHRAASFSSQRFDVCEVVALTEEVSCAQKQGSACKVSTDITAECYDRHAPTVLVTTSGFLTIIFVGLAVAFTKNYLPSFHHFNAQNFDY